MARLSAIFALLLFSGAVCAAPHRYGYDEGNNIAIREIRDSVDDIRHEVSNHEAELRMFDEKIKNQEVIVEALREQVSGSLQASKELVKMAAGDLDARVAGLDASLKGVVSDMRQFKTHANESSDILSQYKEKIVELEKIIEQQNANIAHLQAAMGSLVDAMQVKDTSSVSSKKTYRVKNGDMLEKIARQHQTTVKMIKSLNQLTDDKIKVGQVLCLPED